MNNQTHRLSEVLPGDINMFDGEISLQGDFSLNCTHQSRAGDLYRTGFEMVSDFGSADCMMMGKRSYFAVSETYRFKQGMTSSARTNQPIIGLYFQLAGSAQAFHSSMDLNTDIAAGEANLIIIPPMNEFFKLNEELGGSSFSIILSEDYLQELSTRFPYLLDPLLAKIKQGDFCFLRKRSLPITPRMHDVIQRIQSYDEEHITGSLFLEAQILDLLSLFFTQMNQSASANGSLPHSDQERIHRAREIIIERLKSPPTLAELSRLVGTNEFKLKRGFKEIFDTTPYAYHLQHKLELAKSYILDTNLTIAEIAYRVGYSDPAHLTNAFRKQYGIPPSDLR